MDRITLSDLPIETISALHSRIVPKISMEMSVYPPPAPIPSKFHEIQRFSASELSSRRRDATDAVRRRFTLSRGRDKQNCQVTFSESHRQAIGLRLFRNAQGLTCNASGIHGWGLFAIRDFKRGDPLIEYTGEIIRLAVVERRQEINELTGNAGSYVFRLDSDSYIDATLRGGPARFINHSCDPNCATKVESFDGAQHVIIYAIEDIKRGSELSYDYKLEYEPVEKRIPCACGARNCRRWLNWSATEQLRQNITTRLIGDRTSAVEQLFLHATADMLSEGESETTDSTEPEDSSDTPYKP